jgi:hypothetical protein
VGLVGCGVLASMALGMRVSQRGTTSGAFEADAVDVVVTAASLGLVGIPSAISFGEAPDGLYSLLGLNEADVDPISESLLTQLVLKVAMSAPDIFDEIFDEIEQSHAC